MVARADEKLLNLGKLIALNENEIMRVNRIVTIFFMA
jgi:hypothetical protein